MPRNLAHATSAGGYTSNEPWTFLSWYDTIHNMTPRQLFTKGMGMSGSQVEMWVLLSDAAWSQGVFDDFYFYAETSLELYRGKLAAFGEKRVLIPAVKSEYLWFLLHEHTRKTYVAPLNAGVKVEWRHVSGTKWDLVFISDDGSVKVVYTHWRGNERNTAAFFEELRATNSQKSSSSAPVLGKSETAAPKTIVNFLSDAPTTPVVSPAGKALTKPAAKPVSASSTVVTTDIATQLKAEAAALDTREKQLVQRELEVGAKEELATRLKTEASQLNVREESIVKREMDISNRMAAVRLPEDAQTQREEKLKKAAAAVKEAVAALE